MESLTDFVQCGKPEIIDVKIFDRHCGEQTDLKHVLIHREMKV